MHARNKNCVIFSLKSWKLIYCCLEESWQDIFCIFSISFWETCKRQNEWLMQCLILRERCARIFPLFILGFWSLAGASTCLLGNLRRNAWGITKTCEESGEGEEKKQRLFSSCRKDIRQSKSNLEPGLLLHFIWCPSYVSDLNHEDMTGMFICI